MSVEAWNDAENDLIVADYFAMLADELARRPYSKAQHRRDLMSVLRDRTNGSVEFKHQNISAVLKGLGEAWIPGYKPAVNYQGSLEEAVIRWLGAHPAWMQRLPQQDNVAAAQEPEVLWIGTAPTLSNQPPPGELGQMLQIARRFDVAGRDERNRVLGEAGEARALAHERLTLKRAGRDDLAAKVRWVSQEDGDGAGYDIASFESNGRPKLIEVKTTNGWDRTPFFITRNELDCADRNRSEWCLLRLWDFSRGPKAFELRPPLDRHVSLTATAYQASFN